MLTRRFSKSPYRDQARTFLHVTFKSFWPCPNSTPICWFGNKDCLMHRHRYILYDRCLCLPFSINLWFQIVWKKIVLGKVDLIRVTTAKYVRKSLLSRQEQETMKISSKNFDMSPYHATLCYLWWSFACLGENSRLNVLNLISRSNNKKLPLVQRHYFEKAE